ncbi:MAG: ABC-F family ATP-binding cassette domain-containing protein [Planctomycetes bacterium]|nr:ABC-F family ATP-binding cassette domain-containing protein [Planctomycetota bacterium]
MSAVTLQNVIKGYAGQTVLDDVSLILNKGEKVGLVGVNGSGKTTLFKLVVGVEQPDIGTVTKTRGLTVGYLPQEPDLPPDGILIDVVGEAVADQRNREHELQALSKQISAVHGTDEEAGLLEKYDRLHAEFEARGGYAYEVRIREVLGGVGFAPEEYQQRVSALSGGQKCRASLARMLLIGADLLLLDEPTNHLDIDATRWLEKYLANYDGGAIIISHDRYLLDRVVKKIIEIENRNVETYPTNYSNFAEAKRIRRLNETREYTKQQEWIAHQKDYIDRVRYAKDSAKQARARQKLLANMEERGEILEKPDALAAKMKLQFAQQQKGGNMVVRVEGAAKSYGDIHLIRDLDFEMTVGEKVGIIGPNGVGKTTLLRMLLGQVKPDAGKVRLFENLSVGYYDQEHRDLDPALSVIETVRKVRPEATEAEARKFLALFLFRKDEVFKRVGTLSGGEQSRVLLARLVWRNPQVLVLDEPTNHLDIQAREALESALLEYSGSILMVSHDRYFLDKIATRLLVLNARTEHEIIDGNWSTYSALVEQREVAKRAAVDKEKEAKRRAREEAERKSGAQKPKKNKSKYAAQRIEEIEAQIISHETRIRQIEEKFADPAMMKETAKLKAMHVEYDGLREELVELNAKWEAAVEAQAD